jgi:hypothetical protein
MQAEYIAAGKERPVPSLILVLQEKGMKATQWMILC